MADIVLVTGSSGFLGSAIIKRLADGYSLVGPDRPGLPNAPAPAHTVEIDLGSDQLVREALGTVRDSFGNRIASGGTPR
jgi:nucleoside-diphosphate-sugar epimerase